ncbi:MAG: hypothetical protein ACRDVZ_10790, partial [Jiangellaceae bacterium]
WAAVEVPQVSMRIQDGELELATRLCAGEQVESVRLETDDPSESAEPEVLWNAEGPGPELEAIPEGIVVGSHEQFETTTVELVEPIPEHFAITIETNWRETGGSYSLSEVPTLAGEAWWDGLEVLDISEIDPVECQ